MPLRNEQPPKRTKKGPGYKPKVTWGKANRHGTGYWLTRVRQGNCNHDPASEGRGAVNGTAATRADLSLSTYLRRGVIRAIRVNADHSTEKPHHGNPSKDPRLADSKHTGSCLWVIRFVPFVLSVGVCGPSGFTQSAMRYPPRGPDIQPTHVTSTNIAQGPY